MPKSYKVQQVDGKIYYMIPSLSGEFQIGKKVFTMKKKEDEYYCIVLDDPSKKNALQCSISRNHSLMGITKFKGKLCNHITIAVKPKSFFIPIKPKSNQKQVDKLLKQIADYENKINELKNKVNDLQPNTFDLSEDQKVKECTITNRVVRRTRKQKVQEIQSDDEEDDEEFEKWANRLRMKKQMKQSFIQEYVEPLHAAYDNGDIDDVVETFTKLEKEVESQRRNPKIVDDQKVIPDVIEDNVLLRELLFTKYPLLINVLKERLPHYVKDIPWM